MDYGDSIIRSLRHVKTLQESGALQRKIQEAEEAEFIARKQARVAFSPLFQALSSSSSSASLGPVAFANVSSETTTGAVASRTVAHTINTTLSKGCAIVTVSYFQNTKSISGVTFDGTTMTSLGGVNDTAGSRLEMFALAIGSKAAGAYNVVVNWSGGNADEWSIGIMTFTGVSQSTPVGTPVTASATSAAPGVSITSAANDMVVDAVSMYHSAIKTAAGSQTKRWDGGPAATTNGAGSTVPGPTTTIGWSLNFSGEWMEAAVKLNAG